ncbi:FAD:protein FMN transferase [Companilactobacillus keshanensis]|uniref:FAD:protein FMN transferase n=1 Tax=Companilactobacillus keshanensis TaxID=2486003 RepID=A0ABW4BR59_9LACO|nr:FAD:protein FMN transferase [Companilactobacillus keshanensis]
MSENKYYFPSRIVEVLNVPFTIKLATKNYDRITQDIFHQTCFSIEKDLAQIVDGVYPFRTDSLIRKLQSGSIDPLLDYDTFQSIFAQAKLADEMTGAKVEGNLEIENDSSGLIKGWIIEKVFEKNLRPLLNNSEISGVSLTSGGDMKVATRKGADFYWEIGIKDPNDFQGIATGYYLKNGSVATSEMIDDQNDISKIKQVTIFSAGLIDADVWAKTGISAGIKKFSQMIWKSKLTGILFDQEEGEIPFKNGILKQA